MRIRLIIIISFLTFSNCGIGQNYDGDYCADVTYMNPNTGTQSAYVSTIQIRSDVLQKVNFPNGWLDEDEFGFVKINSFGYASFNTNKGYRYTVKVTQKGTDCFTNVTRAVRCKGSTKSGSRCKRKTDNASGYCWQHE